MLTLIVIAVVIVAYANGANSSFKGVAALYGSGTTSFRTAVNWATITTAAGCVAAMLMGAAIVRTELASLGPRGALLPGDRWRFALSMEPCAAPAAPSAAPQDAGSETGG